MDDPNDGSLEPNADPLPVDGVPVDPVDVGDPSPSDPGAPDDPNADPANPEPKRNTAKDRIDELTRLRREAERDASYWREQALKGQPQQQQPAQEPTSDAEPNPADFPLGEFDAGYTRALASHMARQAVTEALGQQRQTTEAERAQQHWQEKVSRAAEKLPDFEEKVLGGAQRNEWACTPVMRDALLTADQGPEVAYHLANNPSEAQRIARLSPVAQIMELGKLEAKLSAPKPQPKTVTDAPTPAPQVRGGSGQFKAAPDTGDFAAFDKAYGNG